MHSLATETDVRAMHVAVEEARLVVDLMGGRTIAVPLAWYPRLANATPEQRIHWELAGGGYGIHWPDIDEDVYQKDTHFNWFRAAARLKKTPDYVKGHPLSAVRKEKKDTHFQRNWLVKDTHVKYKGHPL